MAATPSTMLELRTKAPDFTLPDHGSSGSGADISRADFEGRPLLVMFICNHCPFVKHIAQELARLESEYAERGVAIVAINSNDVEKYPDDAPDKMTAEAIAQGWGFPYLHDETQEVAKAYRAACTPDFYVFDADHHLVYRGQLDDSRPNSGTDPTGEHLRAALDGVLAGDDVPQDQKPSIGCNIKWKKGNEPDYFG